MPRRRPAAATATRGRDGARLLQVVNDANASVGLSWWDADRREEVFLTSPPHHLPPSARHPIQTFVGHVFIVRERTPGCRQAPPNTAPPLSAGSDAAGAEPLTAAAEDPPLAAVAADDDGGGGGRLCRRAAITISENDDQVARIRPDMTVDFVDDIVLLHRRVGALVQTCQEAHGVLSSDAFDAMPPRPHSGGGLPAGVEAWLACVADGAVAALEKAQGELALHAAVREDLALRSEDYVCGDPDAATTPDLGPPEVWREFGSEDAVDDDDDDAHDGARLVHVKFDRPASKIHVIERFISEEECRAVRAAAEPRLVPATIADGRGGDEVGAARRAMQAGIKVDWSREAEGDPIARLSRRVYRYASDMLGLAIDERGQEDLMSIQYFGRGRNDSAPDRYRLHCDDFCSGRRHSPGARVATMLMYCSLAEVGGHTNFPLAGVHVRPARAGDAVFFSYLDPDALVKDAGFTTHSGCPVYVGHKHIVTQWIRLGVDDDTPWHAFDSNNAPIRDPEAVGPGDSSEGSWEASFGADGEV